MSCTCSGTLKGREVPIGFGRQGEKERKVLFVYLKGVNELKLL